MVIDLAAIGFLAIGGFLAMILLFRIPVLIALILVPVAVCLAGGFGSQIGVYAIAGLRTVAPVAAMIMFAILYFGLMFDAGLFDPMVNHLVKLVRDDPLRLCIVTAVLPMLVAFDGDGATTFLISVTALRPVHQRLDVRPQILPAIIALSAGVMNMLPWGGPTARVMAVLDSDFEAVFVPLVPSMLAGIGWVLFAATVIGIRERRRLAVVGPAQAAEQDRSPRAAAVSAGGLFWFNLCLTAILVLLLFQGLYAKVLGWPEIPPALLFMLAFAIALPVNRRSGKAQEQQLTRHAGSVVVVTSMILAAGIFAGILNGTGAIAAAAQTVALAIDTGLASSMTTLVALSGMPLSLVFTPDAYYFGVLPVFAQAASVVGVDPVAIGRAALLGQMTTGFPLSPLTASTFILIGLADVTLRDHQRFVFGWAFGTTATMTVVARLTGAI